MKSVFPSRQQTRYVECEGQTVLQFGNVSKKKGPRFIIRIFMFCNNSSYRGPIGLAHSSQDLGGRGAGLAP